MAVLTRHGTRLAAPRRAPLVAALAFCIALAGLWVLRADPVRPSEGAARAAALSDPVVGAYLARHDFDRVLTTRLDEDSTRVAFFDGPRIVLEAAVPAHRPITNVNRYESGHVRVGSEVGQRVPVMAALLLLFLLATVRLPLLRIENLDVAALAAFVAPVVLLNERYVEWSVMAACAPLVYLAVRCAHVGLGRPRAAHGPWLHDRLSPPVARLVFGVAAVAFVLVSIPGGLVSDVAYASLAGATKVLDGTLPYGNLAQGDLVHGDTYPLLAYLAYLPGAVVAPVRGGFDNLDGALWVAAGFGLVAAGALVRLGGTRVALAFLAFPPVMIAASSGSNDVVAAALVAVALALGSTAALTAAGWVKLAPLALVPLWVSAAKRRGLALVGAAAVTAALAVVLMLLGGFAGFADLFHAISFQAERGSLLSLWSVIGGGGGAQIVFQAAVIAAIAGASVHVWSDRTLAADPRRMAALGAAILLAVQLAANYWSYTYLAWVFPLLALALLTPSRPPAPSA